MTMHPLDIIRRDMAVAKALTDRPRRPMPDAEKPRSSLFGRLLRRRRDEQIRRAMPWLVASGAIMPGSIYRRRK